MIPDTISFKCIEPKDMIGKTIRGYVESKDKLVIVFEDFEYLPILPSYSMGLKAHTLGLVDELASIYEGIKKENDT